MKIMRDLLTTLEASEPLKILNSVGFGGELYWNGSSYRSNT